MKTTALRKWILKTGNAVAISLAAILLLNFEKAAGFLKLDYLFFAMIFSGSKTSSVSFDFTLFEIMTAPILLLSGLIASLLLRNRVSYLKKEISAAGIVLIILGELFLFAPLIATANPEMIHDISMSRNLPPLSSKVIVELSGLQGEYPDREAEFINLKNRFLRSTAGRDFIIADSVASTGEMQIYKNGAPLMVGADRASAADVSTRVFYFGTDEFGRDIFSRVVFAARLSMLIGILSVTVSLLLGVVLGFIAGYFGGIADLALSRLSELLLSFPSIFMIILFLALFGNSVATVIVVLGVSGWMSLFKVVRGEVRSARNKDFIVASRMLGLPAWKILYRDFIPLLMPSILVNTVFQFANVIVAEASLSFLGLSGGTQYPSWGSMIQEGLLIINQSWWMIIPPSVLLVTTLLSVNSIERKISVLLNPQLEG